MKKKFVLVAMSALLLVGATGCVKTPKLENGDEVIAEVDGKQYTSDDLYDTLKDQYGTTTLVDMIDDFIISQEIGDTKDEKVKAEAYVKQMKEYYEGQGQDWDTVLSNYGYTEDSLVESYTNNYAKESVAKKYYEDNVSDEDIDKYYKDEIIGDITAKHILISVSSSDGQTDEEKAAADKEAYNKALEVITKLNDGGDFAELAKEYSDDESASEGGTLAPFNKQSNYTSEFLNEAIKLNAGEYSKKPVKSEYGYHIIYVESKADKPSLDDVKDTIVSTLAQEAMDANTNYQNTAWKKLREQYNLKIYDTKLSEKYDTSNSSY